MQHAIIRATVPLTEAALTRSRELADTDPLAAPLSSYLDGTSTRSCTTTKSSTRAP
jgi:hypothetical protein